MYLKMNSKPVRVTLSVLEAAAYLGVSRSYLDRDRAAHAAYGEPLKVPYSKLSKRKVLYSKADLDAFLASQRVGHPVDPS